MKLTTQVEIRKLFWQENPHLSKKKIPNYSGTGKMYTTDTRVAFTEFVDMLTRDGVISQELAQRVTLNG